MEYHRFHSRSTAYLASCHLDRAWRPTAHHLGPSCHSHRETSLCLPPPPPLLVLWLACVASSRRCRHQRRLIAPAGRVQPDAVRSSPMTRLILATMCPIWFAAQTTILFRFPNGRRVGSASMAGHQPCCEHYAPICGRTRVISRRRAKPVARPHPRLAPGVDRRTGNMLYFAGGANKGGRIQPTQR